jgi:hypothetical protein
VKGKLADWSFDSGYQYGESDGDDFTHNSVNLTHIQELVGAQPCEPGALLVAAACCWPAPIR